MQQNHPWIDRILSARGEIRLQRVDRLDFSDALLQPLYRMSNALMAEPFDHFCKHARTNDVLHVFRPKGSDRVVGFQFWRAGSCEGEHRRYVLGGKLRIAPEARRGALHLISGLSVLSDEQRAHPGERIVRLSIASLFGMSSIAKRLAHYDFVDRSGPWASYSGLVDTLMNESNYRFDPVTAQVHVGIFVTDEQLEGYPPSFFESGPARAYIERNPEFRTNGSYLAFAFDVNRANVESLARGAAGDQAPPIALLEQFLEPWAG